GCNNDDQYQWRECNESVDELGHEPFQTRRVRGGNVGGDGEGRGHGALRICGVNNPGMPSPCQLPLTDLSMGPWPVPICSRARSTSSSSRPSAGDRCTATPSVAGSDNPP